MLSEFLAVTTLVVTDVDLAKRCYQEQLGLTLREETDGCPLRVDDIESVVRDLTSRGVTFEDYVTPKTVNSIAQFASIVGQ